MAGSVGQYTQGAFAWVGEKATTGSLGAYRYNSSTSLGMGYVNTGASGSPAINDSISWDLYFDKVTWKYCQVHAFGTGNGIYTVQLDGSSQGTIDGYGAFSENQYSEITGLSISTASAKTFKLLMATKNASSSGYSMAVNSWAWIRTGGTASSPAGTDTPGFTWEWIPWMGSKAAVWGVRAQSSSELGGGNHHGAGAQNDYINTDFWRDTGTFTLALVHYKGGDQGIHSFTGLSGTQTIDAYAGANSSNNYSEVTGIAVATADVANLQDQIATKNASSTGFGARINSVKVIRTGA